MIKVFKFGGASVTDKASLKRVCDILKSEKGEIVAVVSAMGKTTNALERLVPKLKTAEKQSIINEILKYHMDMADAVEEPFREKLKRLLIQEFFGLQSFVDGYPYSNYDDRYDQIVSKGEVFSTQIVSHYLSGLDIKHQWLDARDFIVTDNNYRDAKVNFEVTTKIVNRLIKPVFEKKKLVITQGFIGTSKEGHSVTLGREGSDYTSAILAYCLNAESVTIWKDVPGVLNADPKKFKDTVKIDHLSYQDAIELAYYGATVIHPKTIKPLQNKNIPLYVKPFNDHKAKGTLINNESPGLPVPCFISKHGQVLLSLHPKDFSFIAEENISHIFNTFAGHKVKVNMMQLSAVNFSVCFDNDERKIPALLKSFRDNYRVLYNDDVELFTIRYYDQNTINKITAKRKILLEQRSRYTIQLVLK